MSKSKQYKPPSATRLGVFVGVTPRLEYALDKELRAAGFDVKPERVKGGVEVSTDLAGLWRLVHTARLAESVRVRLGAIKAHNFEQLEQGLVKLPWTAYFPRGSAPEVEAVCKKSALYHSNAVAERAAGAICKRLSLAGQVEALAKPPGSVHIRLVNDIAQVSVDAIGEPLLHRRGYRKHVGKAPMRETLAAALLAMIEQPKAVLWDPFCGSGTLPLERAQVVLRRPSIVGVRGFAFEAWPIHQEAAYEAFLGALPAGLPVEGLLAIGSDIDPKEVEASRANAANAGVLDACRFEVGDFERVEGRVPAGAMVVSNLPYGQRIETDRALLDTFRRFGAMLRRRPDLRPVAVINGHPQFQDLTGLAWRSLHTFSNRGLHVEALLLEATL